MIGGMHYETENVWKLFVWKIFRNISSVQMLIPLSYAVEKMIEKADAVAVIWCGIVMTVGLTNLITELILRKSCGAILQVRKFIEVGSKATGDHEYDSSKRKSFYRTTQVTALIVISMITIDEILSPVVAMYEDRYFGLPRYFSVSSSIVNVFTRLIYLILFLPLWVSKVFSAVVEITALVAGCRAELQIFTRGFEEFLENTKKKVLTQPRYRFWTDCGTLMRFQVEQHISHMETQRTVDELLSKFFIVTYYRDVVVIGSLIFIVLYEGVSARSVLMVLSLSTFLVESWWWSMLAEFSSGINTTMQEHMDDLLVAIPYSKEHHSDYRQLRTTVMIMKMITHRKLNIKYAGVFQVNVEAFSRLVDISYSLLAFLLNVGV
nr:uncharacterized protein LOC109422894 [Aedes albopictus]